MENMTERYGGLPECEQRWHVRLIDSREAFFGEEWWRNGGWQGG